LSQTFSLAQTIFRHSILEKTAALSKLFSMKHWTGYGKVFVLLSLIGSFALLPLHGQNTKPDFWSSGIIGQPATPENYVPSNGVFRLTPIQGDSLKSNSTRYVFHRLKGNCQIIARIAEPPENSSAKIGVMIRENLDGDSRFAWMFALNTNAIFERRLNVGEKIATTVATNSIAPRWVRLVREGNAFSGFFSNDGTNWTQISADTIGMNTEIFAGLAVSSDAKTAFDHVQLTSAFLSSPAEGARFVVPTNIFLSVDENHFGEAPRHVQFFSDAETIGDATGSPFTLSWSNALAGAHSLFAKITDASGAEFFTEPVNCEITLPRSEVSFVGIDTSTFGNWKGNYGSDGFNIIRYSTNYPRYAQVSSSGHKDIFLTYSSESKALQLTNGHGRIAAQWFTYTNMTVNVSLLDGQPHQVAFYLFDGENNQRVQTFDVIDAATNRILDSRKVSEFKDGKYLIWKIRGSVKFRVTPLVGNAVIDGIFFDPANTSDSKVSP
jgi:hypothetical protein